VTATLPYSPAAERNQAPIFAVLQGLLGLSGRALEIASGTGQHAVHFAEALPGWQWQPTDVTEDHFPSLRVRAMQAAVSNVAAPRRLDVLHATWPSDGAAFAEPFDLIYCANLLHISPWPTCAALMAGATRHLTPHGWLAVYGPFIEADVPTAPSNLAFDADLRQRDPAWGLRLLADVQEAAQATGLVLAQRHALPANNLLLVFKRAR
jgi:SAM-dependent methyltransferase